MSSGQIDYAALLATWESQRAALDGMISSLRAAIAAGALGVVGDIPPAASSSGMPAYSPANGMGGDVPAGAFFGKSIPDAAKLYLEIVKKKQTSKEISEALQKGGMETNSRNFAQMVHSVLDRARKANSGIVKLDRSHWGLAAWYPAGLIRSSGSASEKRPVSRKKPKKSRVPKQAKSAPLPYSKIATQAVEREVAQETTPSKKGIDVRVMEVLNLFAPGGTLGREIATALGEPGGVVNFSLVRLEKKGRAVRGEDGRYYATKDPE
jgi:hypothetical protein